MAWPIRSVLVYVGLPILSIAALTLYLWQKREENEWSDMVSSLNLVERDVKIPQKVMPALIGLQGREISDLQERTHTQIHFRNKTVHLDQVTCTVVGQEENVAQAVDAIMELIECHAKIKSFDMWIPGTACSRLKGRCGDNIRSLSKESGARITFDQKSEHANLKKLVTIRGTEDQIQKAIALIEKTVREDQVFRETAYLKLSNRSPRGTGNSLNRKETPVKLEYEKLIATTEENLLQVYVSAITSPVHFWLQVVSPRAADLDQLVDHMTEFYNKDENREPIPIEKISKGQVAACLMGDGMWYRVEVVNIGTHADPVEETQIDVFYVDYGESEYVPLKLLSFLRPDFLALRFQAIEANMVGVVPTQGDTWSDSANRCFEDMTHCGRWRVLLAEVVGYKKRPVNSHRAGSPLPCVRLYDPDGHPGVDLGQRLVKNDLASAAPVEELSKQFELCAKDEEDDW